MKLTSLDIRIIKLLADDSRMPALRIAELLGQPESTVRGRISRLVEGKVIEFVAQTNPIKMGFATWVMIGLKISLPRLSKIVEQLELFDEVYFVAVTTGGFDVMINAVFHDNAGLHSFLFEKLSNVEGIVDATTFHYLSVPKRKIAFVPRDQDDAAVDGSKKSER